MTGTQEEQPRRSSERNATYPAVTRSKSAPPEISWFGALCDDDYEVLAVPDPRLASSVDHCAAIVAEAEAQGFDNVLLPSGYALGIDTMAFAAAVARSTQRIRLLVAVRAGEVDKAARILGRPFAIEGVVVEGQHLGRKLGYPTANVFLGDYVRPRLGSYATRTRLADGRLVPGVANIGQNPTTGLVDARLEVWLFDFDEDLYGQTIETELVAFLRPEAKFDSLDELIRQIGADADQARAILTPEL